MPPKKKKKKERCVTSVMRQGKSESSAYAICTSALKKTRKRPKKKK